MSKAFLIPMPEDCNEFIPFFFDLPTIPEKSLCKVYNDGGHYVAVPYFSNQKKRKKRIEIEDNYAREMFDSLYAQALINNLTDKEKAKYLRDNLECLFDDTAELNSFVAKEIKRKLHNLHSRKSRFYRKANLNRWQYFVTITYDNAKHTETEFRKKLRKCLCNLHTRRGWRYMGVFERAPETGRLHFHGLFYIPDGEMLGTITEKQDYSTKKHSIVTIHENEFFAETFGRNDFSAINSIDCKYGDSVGYILKYIGKTGEKITYSRGIASAIFKEINKNDIACEMRDFVLKYVLYDDVIDWEYDVMHFTYEQMTFRDLSPRWLC